MKKSIAIMVAGLTLSMASVAMAGPLEFSGDVSVKYQRDTAAGEASTSANVATVKLLGEADLGSDWGFYFRMAGQHISKPGFGDFNTDLYGEDQRSVFTIDQFGFKYNKEGFAYKLGRQDATVGTTALLYSRPDSNVGKKAFVDGLAVTGTSGITDISALLAREDNLSGQDKNKVYAIRAGFNPSESFNWGVTLGRYNSAASTNHWAVDGTYKYGKSSLTAEYTKASSSQNNKGYAMALGYDFDDKTSASITGFRMEESGSMGGQSDFDANNRGIHYGISHKLTDAASLELVYKAQKTIIGDQKNTSFEATVSYSF